MNERSAKVAVVVIGLAVTAAVVVWRTANALEETAPGQAPANGWSFDVLSEHQPTERFDATAFSGLESVEGLAAEQLALVRFSGSRSSIDRSYAEGTDFLPIRRKQAELGANVTVKEGVEDAPDMPGTARLEVSLWLVHSGPFPGDLLKSRHQQVCVITRVDPTGDAHAGGLAVGDVWTQVESTSALEPASADPCITLTNASRATPVASDVHFTVYRKGERHELTIRKNGPQLKFSGLSVPVLDADRT